MSYIEFTLAFAAASMAEPIYDGFEPPVEVWREELEIPIKIKEIRHEDGKMRIVV